MRRRLLLLGYACLLPMTLAWSAAPGATGATVWIALSEPGGVYAETAEAVRAEFERGGGRAEIVIRPWRELPATQGPPPRLTIAVGVGALRGMAEGGVKAPLLATLVPRAAYLRLAERAAPGLRPHSAVWLDQPVARQFKLLQAALPARRHIGVLLGPESRLLEPELLQAAADRNLEVVHAHIDGVEQLPAALQKTLDVADVLLALPDPLIYNGATIQNILTASYRRRVPLVGFSPAYIRAGALLALYSTPAQVGTQVGEIMRAVLAGRPLPPPQGPREFSVGVNAEVARSLELAVEGDAAARWAGQLRLKERAP